MDTKINTSQDNDGILIDQATLLQTLINQWRKAVEEDFAISIFIIDVDKFSRMENKSVCFEQIFEAIRQQFHRETDFIARFNRKQVMAISSHMNYRQSTQLATRLHKAIASLKLFHPQSPTGRYATVSIGHSTYAPEPNDCYGVLDMLATVIKFVRDAKYEGGNQSKSRLHSRVLK
ncbi:diguanylate cyclase domain-containing protein [Methylophaga thiooxydans]|uniref:diguanylate cyclase domain-containing protein n=1 Tax=Methylophaga thiooxydans TaxID=392484 RepID=UPI00235337A1|nr:diguanylate cyclase [Methylophaga thiooxydans]